MLVAPSTRLRIDPAGTASDPASLFPNVGTWYARVGKRALDLVGAAALMFLLSPLLLGTAVVLLATMGRPVLIRQDRIGRGGRHFNLYKFRTMQPDRRVQARMVAHDRRTTHKHPSDPRLTPLGRRLRRLSLDELPQLLNVLRGDMSLVGPRPEMAFIVDSLYEPWQHARHVIRPGLTGLWQITQRCDGAMHKHTDTDLRYLSVLSLREDLRILARTIPAALTTCRGS